MRRKSLFAAGRAGRCRPTTHERPRILEWENTVSAGCAGRAGRFSTAASHAHARYARRWRNLLENVRNVRNVLHVPQFSHTPAAARWLPFNLAVHASVTAKNLAQLIMNQSLNF